MMRWRDDMEKTMYEVEVSTDEKGRIFIVQPLFGGDDQSIILSPEQVPTLIKWLQEACTEIVKP